jgi:predicted transcriptional regulator
MKQLIIKIGGNMLEDIKKVYNNPSSGKPGTHTIYLKSTKDLYELLSPKRIELLKFIIETQSKKKTVSEIAKAMKRKQEAISRDANKLAKYNLIKKSKEKQSIYLSTEYNSLNIQLTA